MRREQLIDMLKTQDHLERVISGHGWWEMRHNYVLAIFQECSELIDHTNWKWWKSPTDMEWDQIALEVVDLWHFVLAHNLQYAYQHDIPIEKIADAMQAKTDHINNAPTTLHEALYNLFDTARSMNPAHLYLAMRHVMSHCALPEEGLVALYYSKATLNIFRQDKGYKSGEYIKDWGGMEDNKMLSEIIDQILSDPTRELIADTVYAALDEEYSRVLASQ